MTSTTYQIGGVHHFRLTVSDVRRAEEFYTKILGFEMVMELPPDILLRNDSLLLGLSPAPDPEQAIHCDRFDENRVGLDHISFNMNSRQELERFAHRFDKHGVTHGEIKDLGPDLGIHVLAFRDPDNIQLELTAPYSHV